MPSTLGPGWRNFPRGTVIFQEGDPGDMAYLVHQGVVRIVKSVSGHRVTIGRVWPFQLFGELSMIDDAPRMAAAIADEDVVCQVLDRATIRTLMDQAPEGLNALIVSMLATLRAMGQDLAETRARLHDQGVVDPM
jgi:CRP-like cAMP-binding protein